jgi:hypothetical protein
LNSERASFVCHSEHLADTSGCQSMSLLSFNEETLLEVFVRLGVTELAHTASSCKAFANMCRCEWLWQQLSALRGIKTLGAPGMGWRTMYISLSHVNVVGWSPLPLAELKRLSQVLSSISVPAGHSLVCVELELSSIEDSVSGHTSSHLNAHSADTSNSESNAGAVGAGGTVEEPVISGTHSGCFKFGGERWICRLSSKLEDDTHESSSGGDAPVPTTIFVHIARVESDLKCEHPGTQFTCFTGTKVPILAQELVQKFEC